VQSSKFKVFDFKLCLLSIDFSFLFLIFNLKFMTLIIKGSGLTIQDVVNVARHNEKVELHPTQSKG